MGYSDRVEFSTLLGKTLSKIDKSDDRIIFETADGEEFRMYHDQDCCEHVTIEDIAGDLEDLIGNPITLAEDVSSDEWPDDVEKEKYEPESFTWTFYKLATIKGSVTIRWYGSSNGYYSESVSFEKVS